MKKKIALTAFIVATVFGSSNSFGYTVLGSATLTPLSPNSYNLACPGSSGTCYTNTGGLVEIYVQGPHIFCSFSSGEPDLEPGPGGTFRQIGTVEVTVEEE